MIQLKLDYTIAEIIITKLNTAFKEKIGIFEDTKELLEHNIPKDVTPGSLEHARFLFYLIFNDYGTKSSALYEKAKRLYVEYPFLFSPRSVLNRYKSCEDPLLIESTGVRLGTRFPKETARRWYVNSERLLNDYDSDPRSIFKSSTSAKEVFQHIRGFRGFGPKIGALLLRTFVGCGFAYFEDLETVLMPVDIHDTRIAFWTKVAQSPEIVGEPDDYHKYASQIQKVWSQACKNKKVDWLEFDRALWILGSKGCVKRHCDTCPLNNLCCIGMERVEFKSTNQLGVFIDGNTYRPG